MITCRNCKRGFEGNFCPYCGQKPNEGRIILRESARDVAEHYIDFDTPLYKTIAGLITRPGKLIREYIYGKRKSYAHPFRYFIFMLAIYILFKKLTGFDPIETFSEMVGAREMPDPNTLSTKGSNFFSRHIDWFLMIFTFTIATFGKLFNLRSGVYFVEYLTLGFFVVAQYAFFAVFITAATFISPYFFLINYALVIIYPIYVLTSFHTGKLHWRILKSFFVVVLAWWLYIMLGFGISMLIVKTFGL